MGRAFWLFWRVAVSRRRRRQIVHVDHIGVVSIGAAHFVSAVVGGVEICGGLL